MKREHHYVHMLLYMHTHTCVSWIKGSLQRSGVFGWAGALRWSMAS